MMLWMDIIATLIVATLSGMGLGSGGLMVLYLTLIRHAPQLLAQGFNLLFFLFASASSMIVHLLKRRIFWSAVLILILAGLPAAYLGTRVALHLPEGLVAKLFGLFLISVGLPGLFGRNRAKKGQKT
jgi:uncharacterized membrane protein YfcA